MDEFKHKLAGGELKLVYPGSLKAERDRLDQQFRDNKALLQAMSVKPDYVQRLLDQAADMTTYPSDPTVMLPSGKPVTLLGLGAQMAQAVDVVAKSQSVANALADYQLTHSLLPDELKPSVATPDSLTGKTLDEVRAALAAIDQILSTSSAASVMDLTRPELGASSLPLRNAMAVARPGTGTGGDNDGVCAPTHLASYYWFPLKNFVSPMKDQARRGTCWAFAAIGALESRERVQNNNPADLSEQFLINKYKREWDPSDIGDGGYSEYALDQAVARAQPMHYESSWIYNPSKNRTVTPKIANSCEPYEGSCSDSAHQSDEVCTIAAVQGAATTKHCGYLTMTASGASVPSSTAVLLWSTGEKFELQRYRQFLNQGHVLLATFPVYDGFMNLSPAALGVVSDYKTVESTTGTPRAGSYGNHVVQIVGFVPDGPGYFIVKNSWGCGAGDAGYYYVPADYVEQRFIHLSMLSFDARRSDAWRFVQSKTFNSAPTIKWEYGTHPVQGETFALTALVHDIDEPDLAPLCNSTTWAVDAPDTIASATGCAQRIVFNQPGRREVRVTVRDREGLMTSAVLELSVQPPVLNPYPRITSFSVYSREMTGSPLSSCGNVAQTDGTTIDLREKGCNFRFGEPSPRRYFGSVTVENPSNEVLTYEWKYFVRSAADKNVFVELYGGSEQDFDLYPWANAVPVTKDCYVSVTVNAPEFGRTKRRTVWFGRCTYNSTRLN